MASGRVGGGSEIGEIPRIIHQIWLGPHRPPRRLLESVRRLHPRWEYRLWRDGDVPPLRNQDAFDRATTWNGKADVLRYELLWQLGGIYVDADSLALRPLDPLLRRAALFAAYERDAAGLVATGVIGCAPRHPFMERVVRELDDRGAGPAWQIIGPGHFTAMIAKHAPDITLHPARYFYPFHHTQRLRLYLPPRPGSPELRDSFLVQYWGSTTHLYAPWPRRIARRVRYEIERRASR